MQPFFLTLQNNNQQILLTELNKRSALELIHHDFITYLNNHDSDLAVKLTNYYQEQKYNAEFTLKIASLLEEYLHQLWQLKHSQKVNGLDSIELCQNIYKSFIHKRCYKKSFDQELDIKKLDKTLQQELINFNELSFVNFINQAIKAENQTLLSDIELYCLWACHSQAGKIKHKYDSIFLIPEKIDPDNLINIQSQNSQYQTDYHSNRFGFNYTDKGLKQNIAKKEANYCLYCHNRGKDSCSNGLYDKEQNLQKSTSGIPLKGCPLDQKISEMNLLYKDHKSIAALAVAMIDNPMLLLTGHRICNDCMKACIFQNQTPVNIPLIETGILDNVLDLQYGFEIYYLLTLWNPLNFKRPLPKADTNKKVLICGAGPAGISLAYNLLMDGHIAVMIDGLKIESAAETIYDHDGNIITYPDCKKTLFQNLSERIAEGFGGVSEYGITVRWNKNYLKLVRIILERHQNFQLFGGIRFGSQITKEQAFNYLGFDHIAFCMGAGSPNIINMANNLIPGVRKASDFLMSLQLLGSFNFKSLVNLQIRLPIVVIGGGLTAIDTATESLAYYPIQILKFYQQLNELLSAGLKLTDIQMGFNPAEKAIFAEFIEHSKLFRDEIELSSKENRAPNFAKILTDLGGSKIIYRKSLQDSPAYRLNHEEVIHALEEGIIFQENTLPIAVIKDEYGNSKAIKVSIDNNEAIIPAKTILVAAGTKANVIIAKEDADFAIENNYLKLIDKSKELKQRFICYQNINNQAISVFGDMHPYYAGSVVKALASSKNGYAVISNILESRPNNDISSKEFKTCLNNSLKAKVIKVIRLTDNIIEVVIQSNLASQNFKPGQFYRLQNFSKNANNINNKRLDIEPLALTGSDVNQQTGEISLIALEMGGSSNLLQYLKPGEEVILMGPTGTPTEILKDKTIMLAGGGLGNAVLFSIGKALKQNGCKVLYFAGYKSKNDRYKIDNIEAASDVIIWCCDEKSDFKANRDSDFTFTGNIIQAMLAYAKGDLGSTTIKLSTIDRIIAIGSKAMMQAVQEARHSSLVNYLKPDHDAVASINSPMNCMMKEICGQCLQKHINPVTKEEYFVFSCYNQDQNMDNVDFINLAERLSQNSMQEKLTKLWLKQSIN